MSPSTNRPIKEVWVVVPVYNEQEVLLAFHQDLSNSLDHLDCDQAICYVDDGSSDDTPQILRGLAARDQRIHVITLSRNFDHQAALTAGLDFARGDVVITMDGDGQHPPELIPKMLALYETGHDLILTQRIDGPEIGLMKRSASSAFYWFLSRISDTEILKGSADYRLMSRAVLDVICGMREHHRFLRGMVSWMGYNPIILPYEAPKRIAGDSKYTLRKMAKLSANAILSFSLVPLRAALFLGLFFFLIACVEVLYVLSFWIRGSGDLLAPGWSSLMFMLLIVGGSVISILGIVGMYVGYIFQEVKKRPLYIVRSIQGPTTPDRRKR